MADCSDEKSVRMSPNEVNGHVDFKKQEVLERRMFR